MENVRLWHERDISHSSVERVIAPDATIALDFMLRRMTYVLGNLCVYPENMKRNLEKSGGTVFSEKVLLALVDKGVARDAAYRMVQRHALKVGKEGGDLKRECLERRNSPVFIAQRDRGHLGRQTSPDPCRFYFPTGISLTDLQRKLISMRIKIFVSLKNGVLDPQGKAIERSLHTLGYTEVQDIRVGKYSSSKSTRLRATTPRLEFAKCVISY